MNKKIVLTALTSLTLLSCGGGSSSGSNNGGSSGNGTGGGVTTPPTPSYTLQNDTAFAMPGETVTIDVLANDSAANLQLNSVTSGSLGSASIVANQIEYTAGQQGSVTETLEYIAQDDQDAFGGATLEIIIAPADFDVSGLTAFLDSNGDSISEQELQALGLNLPAGTFALYDLNGDGVLDESEMDLFALEILNDLALPAFDAADLNGDGELNLDEAINFLPP